jgi:hypothetical protein
VLWIGAGADEAGFLRPAAGLPPHPYRHRQHQQGETAEQRRLGKSRAQPGSQRRADDPGQAEDERGTQFGLASAQPRQAATQGGRAYRRQRNHHRLVRRHAQTVHQQRHGEHRTATAGQAERETDDETEQQAEDHSMLA